MDELFAPPAYQWRRLAPAFLRLRRLSMLISLGVLFSAVAVLVGLATGLWWLAGLVWAAMAVLMAVRWVVLGRNYRSWGYVERDEDLYVTNGVLFRTLIAVPYGRMQLVEVQSGPLQRAFGVATVTLKTASPATDAAIPGLEPAEATRLRDRLTELAETRDSGL